MSYLNDPREMAIRPESGVTLEEDNRYETMYHWGAHILDLCDLPVEEYMKPMTVITDGSGGGGGDTGSTNPTYFLKFVLDGETKKSYNLEEGAPIPSFSGEKEGYDFSGWKDSEGNEHTTMPASNLTLYGTNTIKKFTVKFIVDNEELSEYEQIVNWNTKVTNIPSSSKTGYVFSGWDPAIPAMIKSDFTFEGSFTKKIYNVSFNISGQVQSETYAYEDIIEYPAADSKEGYTICGWTPYYETMPDINNIVFKAVLSANEYTVKYLIDFGEGADYSVVSEHTVKYGQNIPSQAVPSQSGYSFTEWSADTQVIGNKMPASDVNFFTKRTTNEYTLSYYIDGVQDGSVETYSYGTPVVPRAKYEKEGYTVTNWVFDHELNVIPEELGGGYSMPYYNVVANCTTSINSYNVVFKHDNDVVSSGSAVYGTEISTLVPEGYSYTGSVVTVPASDIELSVDINSYNVTVNIDGTNVVLDLEYKSDIKSAIEDYINEHYQNEMVGHHIETNVPEGATVPAHDVNYTASIVPNEHTITVSGNVINVNYGENVADALEDIVDDLGIDEFHYLDGWLINGQPLDDNYTMPDEDITIEPVIKIKEAEVTPVVSGETASGETYDYGTPISEIIEDIVENASPETKADLEDPGYAVEWTVNGSAYTPDMVVREDEVSVEVTITPKPFRLTFMMRGTAAAAGGVIESGDTLYKEAIEYPETPASIEASGKTFEFKWDEGSVAEGTPMPSSAVTVYGEYVEKVESSTMFYSMIMEKDLGEFPDFAAISQHMSSATLSNMPEYLSMRLEGIPEYEDFEGEDEEWDAEHMYKHIIIIPHGKTITSYKVGALNQPNIAGSRYESSLGTTVISDASYDVYAYQREDYYVHETPEIKKVYITIE